MKRLYIIFFCIGLWILFMMNPATLMGQNVKVNAQLQKNQIKIGQQTNIVLSATTPQQAHIVFPPLADTLIGKVDIVNQSKIDTLTANNQITYQQIITITSFDSGYFAIPPFSFRLKDDTTQNLLTEALLLTVQTVPVDTTQAIKEIKPILQAPFSIWEYKTQIILGIVVIAAVLALIYYFRKIRKPKTIIAEPVVVKRPAHEIALEALNQLKEQKLWQQGQVKEYHIIISDTIRTYIEGRYEIGAMEMTSDEILRSIRLVINNEQLKQKLTQVLVLSDMVKFAKESPLPLENEKVLEFAFDFVNETLVNFNQEESKNV